MSNNSNFISIIGLLLSLYIVCNVQEIREGWNVTPMIPIIQQSVTTPDGKTTPLPQNSNLSTSINPTYYSTPSYTSVAPPRFSSVGFSSGIKYNIPDSSTLGNTVPSSSPYSISPPSVEKFTPNGCSVPAPSTINPTAPKSGYGSSGNDTNQSGSKTSSSFSNSTPMMTSFGDSNQETPVVVTNNLMWTNSRSKLRSQGDWLRGDLAIVPCEPGWFRPSIVPSRDLHNGALAVIGGINNATAAATASLMFSNTAGLSSSFAGVPISSTSISGTSSNGRVSYTAFP